MQPQPITPSVFEVVESTTPQTTVVDVLLGAFAVVGVIGLVAFVLGLSLAGVLILTRRLRGRDQLSGQGGATELRLNS